jgi:signal transduction histidine kinase
MSRILIADDEDRIAGSVQKGMQSRGFTSTVVTDGAALDHALSSEFACSSSPRASRPGGFVMLDRIRRAGNTIPVRSPLPRSPFCDGRRQVMPTLPVAALVGAQMMPRSTGLGESRTKATRGRRTTESAPPKRRSGWRGDADGRRRGGVSAFRSTRVRILAYYLVLLAFCSLLSTVVARQVLSLRLESRIEGELTQEVQELDRLVRDGRDPTTGAPFGSARAVLDLYLERNVPSEGEAYFAYASGQLHGSSLDRYPLPTPPEAQGLWLAQSRDFAGAPGVSGVYETSLGQGQYQTRAFTLGSGRGLFVVARLPAGELREISEIGRFGLAADVGVLLFATLLAWPLAGRVLAPVRQLTQTARAITESDMTSRVPVVTTGEAADMAQSFNAMLDRLQEVLRSQREFVRRAGHEMRDPLAICRGHLELFEATAPDAADTISLVLDEIDRMGRLVGDLQILADAEQPDFVRPERLDVALFTHELVAKSTVMAERVWRLDAAADVTTLADRHRITEAVMNLVHNAVMHTSPTDVVAIGSATAGDHWSLWVRDTGIGLPEETDLCTPYVRGTEARARYQGSGLGLAIVQLVAQTHDGRLEIEGLPRLGATFTLVLPLTGPHVPGTDEADHPENLGGRP